MVSGEDGAERLIEHLGDLLETQFGLVAQMDHALVRWCQSSEGFAKLRTLIARVVRFRIRSRSSESGEHVFLHRNRMAHSPTLFVAQPVQGDAEEPGFEAPAFDIGRNLFRHGAEGALGDLFREIGVATLRPNQPEDAWRIVIDERSPRPLVSFSGKPKQETQSFRSHASGG